MGGKQTLPENVETQEILQYNVEDFEKSIHACKAPDGMLEKDYHQLLLNTSAFGGYNIYYTSEPTMIDSLTCVTVPKGTWVYRAQASKDTKTIDDASWYGSLNVAKLYAIINGRNFIIARQVNEPLILMMLTVKKNIQKILQDENIDEKKKSLIRTATGVDISSIKQLRNILKKNGMGYLFKIAQHAVFLPSRYSHLHDDIIMMKEFCKYFTKSLAVHGYIASYMKGVTGTFHEELAICEDARKNLSKAVVLDISTADKLIEKYNYSSSSAYTYIKMKLKTEYATVFLIGAASLAYKQYRHKMREAVYKKMIQNAKKMEKSCKSLAKNANNTHELIQMILFNSVFLTLASVFVDPETGKMRRKSAICKHVNDVALTRPNIKGSLTTMNVLGSIFYTLMPNIWSLFAFFDHHPDKGNHERVKTFVANMKKEPLPDLDDITGFRNFLMASILKDKKWKTWLNDDPQNVRKKALSALPGILSVCVIDLQGNPRTSRDILRASALYIFNIKGK